MAGCAVVDLETTGLFPGGHDRIVEVGVVLVSPDLCSVISLVPEDLRG